MDSFFISILAPLFAGMVMLYRGYSALSQAIDIYEKGKKAQKS